MALHSSDHPATLPVEEAVQVAAETGGHVPPNAAAEAAEHGSGGLPQFEFSHWGGQVAYLLILFAILYLLIAKVFTPRLRRVLDERRGAIAGAVATARQVQEEADAQAAAAKAEVEAARAEARATAVAARAKANEEAQARNAQEEAEVAARISAAEAQIAQARDAAMGNVDAVASDTARAIVERLTGPAPTAAAMQGAA
jgi:F-type H+-transporting ATPase subunit b